MPISKNEVENLVNKKQIAIAEQGQKKIDV